MEGEDRAKHDGVKLGGSENLVLGRVLDNAKTRTAVIAEMGLRMDKDEPEGAIEERAVEKETDDRSSRVLLHAGLRRERGMLWRALHVSFITRWKTSLNEANGLTTCPCSGFQCRDTRASCRWQWSQ